MPIIICVPGTDPAIVDPAIVEAAFSAGADDLICQPISQVELRARIWAAVLEAVRSPSGAIQQM